LMIESIMLLERVFIPQSMEVAPFMMIDVDVLASYLIRVGGGGGGGGALGGAGGPAKLARTFFLASRGLSGGSLDF